MRLGEKVVAAGLDAAHPVAGVVERGDEYHRNAGGARVALDAAADFEPGGAVVDAEVARRHRDIEDAEIGMMLEGRRHRGRSVDGGYRFVTQAVQLVEQQLDVGGNVVSDENYLGLRIPISHIRVSPSSRSSE